MATREETARALERERIVMATAAIPAAIVRFRVSWGGVWAGFLVSLGVSILLGALGLAIGVTVADVGPGVDATAVARGIGIAAGAWAFGTLVVSLFIGGMVAARGGAIVERSTATTQGMLVWVLSILATTYLAAAGIGLGASALGRVTGGAAQLAGGSDLVADLNAGNVDRLLARLNDPQTASTIAEATGMSQPDVQRTLADASARVQANRNDPTRAFSEGRAALRPITDRLQQQAAQTAAQAKPYAAATSWATFVALVISLFAAILGGLAGRRRVDDAVAPYA